MQALPQSRESREIFGENETTKKAPRRDQSPGLESRLQPLVGMKENFKEVPYRPIDFNQ